MRTHRQPGVQAPDAKSNRLHLHSILIGLGLGTLLVFYLLQVFSPLRINTDVYRLLSMAVSAHEGNGYLVDGHVDQFPALYPFFIKTLLDLNIADSSTLVIFNLFWLGIGFSAFLALMGRQKRTGGLLGIVWMLSSWVMCKHAVLPLTDCLYLGLSLVSVWAATRFFSISGGKKWVFMLMAVLFAVLSMQCRTIGIALFPSLLLVVALHKDYVVWRRYATDHLGFTIVLSLCLLLVFSGGLWVISGSEWFQYQFIEKSSYFSYLTKSFESHGLLGMLKRNLEFRLIEFGEIFLNAPYLRLKFARSVFLAAGFLAWALVGLSIVKSLHKREHLGIAAYVLCYIAIMFIWPYYDARFWIPVYPAIFILFYSTYNGKLRNYFSVRVGLYVYFSGVFLLGLAALILLTKVSMSGDRFSECYGDGTDRMTYRVILDNGLPVDQEQVDFRKVELIERF